MAKPQYKFWRGCRRSLRQRLPRTWGNQFWGYGFSPWHRAGSL